VYPDSACLPNNNEDMMNDDDDVLTMMTADGILSRIIHNGGSGSESKTLERNGMEWQSEFAVTRQTCR